MDGYSFHRLITFVNVRYGQTEQHIFHKILILQVSNCVLLQCAYINGANEKH